jgi:hypothetical protein
MAAEVSNTPMVNGYGAHQAYDAQPQPSYTPAAQPAYAPPAPAAQTQQNDIPKDEVGWYFVEQYYTTLSRSPEKLYLFYNKRSQFVSGQETDKVAVCVGQRAINDRIKELDFHDAKVRVTNVDSQASDSNIVIQVIGEISNKSEPPRKFTQTFVLATQTNGYFVLNDIFRYLIEEEDEEPAPEASPEVAPVPQQEEIQQAPAAESGFQEPPSSVEHAEPKTLTSSLSPAAVEHDAQEVDKELEEKVLKNQPAEEESAPAVNGVAEPETSEATQTEETPAAAQQPQPESKDAVVEPEKPKDPTPSPAPAPAQQAPPPQPAAPPKPAAPKTWASLAASANRTVATPATPAVPTQPQNRPAQPKPAALAPAPAPAPQAAPAAPVAEQEEGSSSPSQDEWTAVGSTHSRQISRQINAQQSQGPQNRAYIKNVTQDISDEDLRSALTKYGKISYLDIARAKVSDRTTHLPVIPYTNFAELRLRGLRDRRGLQRRCCRQPASDW